MEYLHGVRTWECHGSDCSDPVRISGFFCLWKQSWHEDNYIFFTSMVILFIIRSLKQVKKSAFCDCSACTDCRKDVDLQGRRNACLIPVTKPKLMV